MSLHTTPKPMKWNGSLCMAPQVTFRGQRRCQHSCCATWSCMSLMRELRGWTGLGSIEMQKVVLGRLLQQRSHMRRDWKMSPMHEDNREDVDDEDMDEESESPSSSGSTVGDLLPACSQDTVITHATEDELRSLD